MSLKFSKLHSFFFLLLAVGSLHARGKDTSMQHADVPLDLESPWMTGPLLTPSATTTPKGHLSPQPYLFFSNIYGHFNNHWKIETKDQSRNINFQFYINYGLTEWMDAVVMGQFHNNTNQKSSSTGIGDSIFGFDFQLITQDLHGYRPAVKFFVLESFPTGTYNNLNPALSHTDATGDGSYGTKIGLSFGKIYQIKDYIWLNGRFSFAYFYFSPVHVNNYNTYGGGMNTKGIIHRRGSFPVSVGAEISFTKNLVFACDILSLLSGPNRFKGEVGVDSEGFPAKVGGNQVYELSLAPAFEWNFSEKFGIVAGSWFSIYGKNADQFVSGVISLNIYI